MHKRTLLFLTVTVALTACGADWPVKVPVDVVERAMHRNVSPDAYQAINKKCNTPDQIFSNTIFRYHDQKHGVTLDVPYNVEWVDVKGATLSPINFQPDAVHFGARRWAYNEETNNCEPIRDFTFQGLEPRTMAQAKSFYRSEYGVTDADFSEEKIGDHTALVIRNIHSDCAFTAIEVFSSRDNILLTLSCTAEGKFPNSAEALRTIVRTMEIEDTLQ